MYEKDLLIHLRDVHEGAMRGGERSPKQTPREPEGARPAQKADLGASPTVSPRTLFVGFHSNSEIVILTIKKM